MEALGLITREKVPNEQVGYIRVNYSAFKPIVDFYIKKKDFCLK